MYSPRAADLPVWGATAKVLYMTYCGKSESAAVPVGAASPEHVRQHVKAVQKIKDAENGWGQAAIQGSDDG